MSAPAEENDIVLHRRAASAVVALALTAALGCLQSGQIYREVRYSRAESYRKWARTRERVRVRPVLKGDLSLQRALEVAVASSKQIKAALQERQRAGGRLWQGYSEFMPRLTAFSSYYRLDKPTGGTVQVDGTSVSVGARDNYTYGFVFRQPLFRGGAVPAVTAAQIFGLAGEEEIRWAVETVMYEVARLYQDVLLTEKLHEVRQDALASAEVHLEDVLKRQGAGLSTEFDVLRAKVEVSNARTEMIRQAARIELAKASLLRAMGISEASDVNLSTPLNYGPISPEFEDAVKVAYENRPDLFQAELEVRAQKEALQIARSRWLPALEASFTCLWSNPDPHVTSRRHWGRRWYGSLSANWTIFDGLRREGEILEHKAILRKKMILLEEIEERVPLEIEQALSGIRVAEQLIEAQDLNVEQAKEGLRLATRGYPEVTTVVDVQDARAALMYARGLYWEAVYDHAVARLELQKATGVLGPPPGARWAPQRAFPPGRLSALEANPLPSPRSGLRSSEEPSGQ